MPWTLRTSADVDAAGTLEGDFPARSSWSAQPVALGTVQQAPDPPRRGDTPCRPSTFALALTIPRVWAWCEDRYGFKAAIMAPNADMPIGSQLDFVNRDNLDRPDYATTAAYAAMLAYGGAGT